MKVEVQDVKIVMSREEFQRLKTEIERMASDTALSPMQGLDVQGVLSEYPTVSEFLRAVGLRADNVPF